MFFNMYMSYICNCNKSVVQRAGQYTKTMGCSKERWLIVGLVNEQMGGDLKSIFLRSLGLQF